MGDRGAYCVMTQQGIYFVVLAAVLTVISNFMLRAGVTLAGGFTPSASNLVDSLIKLIRQPLFLGGLTFYSLAALVWIHVISTENLNASYPLLIGLTFLLVILGTTILFREPLSWMKIIGISLIFLGVIVISRS